MTTKEKGKPRGKGFLKGNKHGKGRQKITAEDKELRKIGKEKFRSTIALYINYTKADLNKVIKDKNTTAVQFIVAAIIIKAMKQGDTARADWIVQQAYGKW